jgi:hypothetical protein
MHWCLVITVTLAIIIYVQDWIHCKQWGLYKIAESYILDRVSYSTTNSVYMLCCVSFNRRYDLCKHTLNYLEENIHWLSKILSRPSPWESQENHEHFSQNDGFSVHIQIRKCLNPTQLPCHRTADLILGFPACFARIMSNTVFGV